LEDPEVLCENEELLHGGDVHGGVFDGEDAELEDCDAFAFARSESLEGAVGLGLLTVTELSGRKLLAGFAKLNFK